MDGDREEFFIRSLACGPGRIFVCSRVTAGKCCIFKMHEVEVVLTVAAIIS